MACVARFGLVQPPARVGPEGVSDVPVDPSEVKPFRVEMATAPALHLGVLGVERIGHDFEKGFETETPPTSSGGRARAPSKHAAKRGVSSRASHSSISTM